MADETMVEIAARAHYTKLAEHAAILHPGTPFETWEELPEQQRVMQRAGIRAALTAILDAIVTERER